MDNHLQSELISLQSLIPIVRSVLGKDELEITEWHFGPLNHQPFVASTRGVFRVSGRARSIEEELKWSLILKIVQQPTAITEEKNSRIHNPSSHSYWKREPAVYQSSFLQTLSGLSTPRFFGTQQYTDGTIGIWLEDLKDNYDHAWPLERYHLAARHLALFNARFLLEENFPDYEWLCSDWLVSGITRPSSSDVALLQSDSTWTHPLVHSAFPKSFKDQFSLILENRNFLLDRLALLPQTVCHHDASCHNLFSSNTDHSNCRTVAIDWASLGTDPIGTDLCQLIFGSILWPGSHACILPHRAKELEAMVLAGYHEALRETGYEIEFQKLQFAYATTVAVRYSSLPSIVLRGAITEAQQIEAEKRWHISSSQIMDHFASVFDYLIALYENAMSLAKIEPA